MLDENTVLKIVWAKYAGYLCTRFAALAKPVSAESPGIVAQFAHVVKLVDTPS